MSSSAVGRCTQHRAVHLRDRPRRDRVGLDAFEHVLPGDVHLLLHDAHDLLARQRRNIVLQRREFLDELRRQQVGSGGEHLPQLLEGRTEFFEWFAQEAGLVLDVAAPFGDECFADAERGDDAADLSGATKHLPFEHRGIGGDDRWLTVMMKVRRVPISAVMQGVDQDDAAAGHVRNTIGHVLEQELLAIAHTGVAAHDEVDVFGFRDMDDCVSGVGWLDHQAAAALAGKLPGRAGQRRVRRGMHPPVPVGFDRRGNLDHS
jgi:hypothetical protein